MSQRHPAKVTAAAAAMMNPEQRMQPMLPRALVDVPPETRKSHDCALREMTVSASLVPRSADAARQVPSSAYSLPRALAGCRVSQATRDRRAQIFSPCAPSVGANLSPLLTGFAPLTWISHASYGSHAHGTGWAFPRRSYRVAMHTSNARDNCDSVYRTRLRQRCPVTRRAATDRR